MKGPPIIAISPLPSIAPTSSYGWERGFFDDFDADWGHFFAGGEGGYVTRNTVASWLKYNWEDSPGALKLTARAQMSSSAVVDMTPFVDTVNGYDLVRVKFYWYTHSFENAEDYFVEYCADGLSCLTWEQLGQLQRRGASATVRADRPLIVHGECSYES